MQQRPGGPLVQAPSAAQGAIRAGIESLGVNPADVESAPSTLDAEKTAFSQFGSGVGRNVLEHLKTWGPLAPASLLGQGIESSARGIERGVPEAVRGAKTRDPYTTAHGAMTALSSALQAFGMKEGAEAATSANPLETAKSVGRGIATAGKEIEGRGPSMDRLDAAQDLNALEVKNKYLIPAKQAAHNDAQATIQTAVKQMQERYPAGVVSKADLAKDLGGIWNDIVKTDEAKPGVLDELTNKPPEKIASLNLNKQSASLHAAELRKAGFSKPDIENSLINDLGYTKAQAQAILSSSTETQMWDVDELQQKRSALGRYAFGKKGASLTGAARTAAVKGYARITEVLNDAASNASARSAWEAGNSKWRAYLERWEGSFREGKFHDSPLAEAIEGDTAQQIMHPLVSDSAQQARDFLGRYRSLGVDMDTISKLVGRHKYLEQIRKMSSPTKYEYAMAAGGLLGPVVGQSGLGAGLSAYGLYRILGPALRRYLATRGVDIENVRGLSNITPGVPGAK
jgi:hypothetical protein